MKIKWLVAYVIAVGCLDRAKRAITGVIVAGRVFWSIEVLFVAGEPLSCVGTPS